MDATLTPTLSLSEGEGVAAGGTHDAEPTFMNEAG